MEDRKAKQRLVGAIVIVSLAVIFIPMLLNTEDNVNPLLIGSNIPDKPDSDMDVIPLTPPPPRPQQKPITVIPVDENSAAADTQADSTQTTTDPETGQAPTEAASAVTPEQQLSGWVVQLGSFSKKQNALELRNKARSHGFAAFVEAYSSKSGQRYRVRVGPEISVEDANKLKQEIKRKMGTDGLVLRHK